MALKLPVKEYREWILKTDFFFNRYKELLVLFEKFIETNISNGHIESDAIAKELWTAYNRCDEIDYNEDNIAFAYSIIHFMDRYHRFIITFQKLIDHKYLPLSHKEIEILDVGTGPGPGLYAISDIYNSIIEFAKATDNKQLLKLKFKTDYVERSIGFRNWLHNFTEFINYNSSSSIKWLVPYHHGTYEDFEKIEFNIKSNYYNKTFISKRRFNIVLFSNFLTQTDQVDNWENQIRNCFRFLRNRGKLITVGGKGGSKYQQIYSKLDEKLLNYNFSSMNNIGKCSKLNLSQKDFKFDLSDRYGSELKNYFRKIYSIFEDNNSVQYFTHDVKYHFENYKSSDTGRAKQWSVQVYEKYARLKWYKFR
jgi:ribosomal protein RSM22 (predicted rRNA methylase)